jgi:hypothetical protein
MLTRRAAEVSDPAGERTLKTLVLVCEPDYLDPRDFVEIGREILRRAKDIDVNIIGPHDDASVLGAKWARPSLTVALCARVSIVPPRGALFQNKPIKKIDQYHRLATAGIPSPKTAKLEPSSRFSEADWGEFVVLKPLPLAMSSSGEHMKLMRTRRLDAAIRSGAIASLLPNGAPALVQQFIDTGHNPTNWRVLTLFGHALYSMKFRNPNQRPDLASDDATIEAAIIETKHPDLKKTFKLHELRSLEYKPEMLDFAARVYSAFPTIPLQGVDILEEHGTGKLYALEINGGSNTWHFSSPRASLTRRAGMTREDRIAQFGAWGIAADALIDATRRFAS